MTYKNTILNHVN